MIPLELGPTGGKVVSLLALREGRTEAPQGPKCPTCGLPSDPILAWNLLEGRKSFPKGQIFICLNGEWAHECWTVMDQSGKKGFLPCPYHDCKGSLVKVFAGSGAILSCSYDITHRFEPSLTLGFKGKRLAEIELSYREQPWVKLWTEQLLKQDVTPGELAIAIEGAFAEFAKKMKRWRRLKQL